jgi:hypothetical protein
MPNFSDSFFLERDFPLLSNSFSILGHDNKQLPVVSNGNNSRCSRQVKSCPKQIKQIHKQVKSTSKQVKSSKLNVKDHEHKLKVVSINVNGLRSKALDLKILIHTEKPDIICCQETRIDESMCSSEFFPNEYAVHRKDRDMHGGGVCIAVSDRCVAHSCPDLNTDTESIWVKIQNGHRPTYVCSFYRPPGSPASYVETFSESVNKIQSTHRNKIQPHILVLGDFNFPGFNWCNVSSGGSAGGQALLDFLLDFSMTQLVDVPTRFGNNTSSILDLVISNIPHLIDNLKVGPIFSDHCILTLNINKFAKTATKLPHKVYQYQKTDFKGMKAYILSRSGEFNQDVNMNSLDKSWLLFKSLLEEAVNKFTPIKMKYSNQNKEPPWLSTKLKRMIKLRDKLSGKALKSNNQCDKDLFKSARSKTKQALTLAYNSYLQSIIGNVKQAPSKFYKFVNSKRTEHRGISNLNFRGKAVFEDKDKADVLNEYFANSFTTEQMEKIPFTSSIFPSMDPITITNNGVTKLLEQLDKNKSKGPDGISPYILKECACELAPLLTIIFNQSINSGQVPADWLDANVVPLHKKGKRDEADNYRPVSLTCIISKVLEHIIFSSIARHLENYQMLSPAQHGFRPGYSCETQLIAAFNDWAKTIDANSSTDVVILDFSKAFDSVPHERLKSKLHFYGVRGQTLKWIDAFLSNRRQRVILNGACSDWSLVKSGVPQGSVLGPLLFLLYINDIGDGVESNLRLFADDCVLYRAIKNTNDSIKLQNDLNKLANWGIKWQMKFNVQKCFIMKLSQKD